MGFRGSCLAADAMTEEERSYVTPLGLHPLAAILLISTHKKIGQDKFSGLAHVDKCGHATLRGMDMVTCPISNLAPGSGCSDGQRQL